MKHYLRRSMIAFLLVLFVQQTNAQTAIYHDGWTDFNKNNKKDIFEDAKQPVEKRIENLLSLMTVDEKTVQ
jgi:beta-glucosidase